MQKFYFCNCEKAFSHSGENTFMILALAFGQAALRKSIFALRRKYRKTRLRLSLEKSRVSAGALLIFSFSRLMRGQDR
ncbi:Uncharacterized protein dnm_062210 [Desulfonema magnum]|uniref:Uncharacterized protein n=1 Tax=Desulfonema magnum TaxID=45655 RepID=A0A975BSA9_9BACT|nr:Uncharacterized protein dnm_062210 [Desulfonema magnum]